MIDCYVATQQGVRRGVPLAVAALLLAGCATMAPKTPEEAVGQRAQARWEALLAGNAEEAYTYYSPGYRSEVKLDGFRHRLSVQRVEWTGAELQGVTCETDICRADLRVSYKYRMQVRGVGQVENSRVVTEDWIRADGGWFFVPPRPGR